MLGNDLFESWLRKWFLHWISVERNRNELFDVLFLEEVGVGDWEGNDVSASEMSGDLAFVLLLHFVFVDLEEDRISKEMRSWCVFKLVLEEFSDCVSLIFVLLLFSFVSFYNIENDFFFLILLNNFLGPLFVDPKHTFLAL